MANIITAPATFVDSKVEEGMHSSVCTAVDVFDKDEPDYDDRSKTVTKKKAQFTFYVPMQGPVQSKAFNAKLSRPNAKKQTNLTEFLTGWLGAHPGLSFDLDTLVGKGAKVMVEHRQGDSRTFIDVTKARPLPEKDTPDMPDEGEEEVPF